MLERSGFLSKNQNTVIAGERSDLDCVPEVAHVHCKSAT